MYSSHFEIVLIDPNTIQESFDERDSCGATAMVGKFGSVNQFRHCNRGNRSITRVGQRTKVNGTALCIDRDIRIENHSSHFGGSSFRIPLRAARTSRAKSGST